MLLYLSILLLVLLLLRPALRIRPIYASLLAGNTISNNPASNWDRNKIKAIVDTQRSKHGHNKAPMMALWLFGFDGNSTISIILIFFNSSGGGTVESRKEI